jgi:YVTN family beta-propeller protein
MCELLRNRMRLLAAVTAGLVLTVGVRAEDQQPLERIAVIALTGKAGALDHLGADWKNSRLFVANQSNDTLEVVDVKNDKVLQQVSGQKQIHGIAYAADLDRIFAGNGEGVCNAIDGKLQPAQVDSGAEREQRAL